MIFFEDLAKPQKATGYRFKGSPYSKAVKAVRESGLRAFLSFRRCPWTKNPILLQKSRQSFQFFLEGILAMTTDEVLDALGRYTKDSKESDRQTATKLGIRRSVLWDWLRGGVQPEKCALARLAGFLKRVGYL